MGSAVFWAACSLHCGWSSECLLHCAGSDPQQLWTCRRQDEQLYAVYAAARSVFTMLSESEGVGVLCRCTMYEQVRRAMV